MTIEQVHEALRNEEYLAFWDKKADTHFCGKIISIDESMRFPAICEIDICGNIVDVHSSNLYSIMGYRGSFDSSVLPPLYGENYSQDVIAINEDKELRIIYYNFDNEGWYIRGYGCFSVPYKHSGFKWCFKPDYLTF